MHTVLRTDTQRIPIIDGDPDTTVEFVPPWLLPPVTRVHRTPRARLARHRERFLAGQFAADVRAGYRRGLAVMGAFGAACFFIVLVRGAHVAAEIVGLAP